MDLTYIRKKADGSFDSGYLTRFEADFDIKSGEAIEPSDFAIKMSIPESPEDLFYSEGSVSSIIFAEGTEYGGEIRGSEIDTGEGKITYTGRTWRGSLAEWIIEPPEGEDYLVVSGNLAESIRLLPFSDYLRIADTEYSGGTFQFNRYIPTDEGITALLKAADPSLRISIAFHEEEAYTGKATLSIEPARDLTALIEASQDYNDRINLKLKRDHATPRHLICLGAGELHEREVIHLYADDDWNITTDPIPGAFPVETYDFSSSEDLEGDGRKHFAELISSHETIDVSISDLGVQLGDIIAAKDQVTGEKVSAEITNIIYRCSNNGEYTEESYEYKPTVRR